ncbi:Zinc finger ccch-type containing 14 [Plakobranchus ocellatus]|uniref:Zinc finger CCCH domain-containing protein 14 n=1 Tax=Plakobranchus ocellatus TaxID=259542 RepID=A0AAV4CNT8_9GAST|nr:Zinc finger ccch-type containing 14 [Plakobranchus ocellatus]
MSEAEKSVAVKRKVGVTRPINRQSSPAEYSPKRKRSSIAGEKDSPPPYIPSRKVKGETSSSSQLRSTASSLGSVTQKSLSRDDIRHSLGRHESRGLISASRREEMQQDFGSGKNSSSNVPKTRQPPSQMQHSSSPGSDDESSRVKSRISDRTIYGREVRGDSKAGDVKNLQITARVGPLRADPSRDSSSKSLRVAVISDKSRKSPADSRSSTNIIAKKPQIAARLSEPGRSTVVRDAREDIKKARKGQALQDSGSSRSARVISRSAREAVQKQCKAAVMSVTAASAGSTRARDSSQGSPDSRVVRCESESPTAETDRDSGKNAAIQHAQEVGQSDEADSDASDNQIVKEQSPEILLLVDKDKPVVSSKEDEKVGSEVEEVEDLSQMLEGEDLDSELLLKDEEEKNEFTLDLDDEELSHVVEEVAAEVGEIDEAEADNSKSGIRFIVTLDGVDEAQFDDRTGKSEPNVASTISKQPLLLNPSPSQTPMSILPPSTPARPSIATAQPLPPLASTPAQTAAKMRPPKIQPFSISLRDSDDEHEEKVVTYIQANDLPTVESVVEAETEEELSALQRARSQERCRYWPACMAGSDCQYHHPTTYCKTFPNCKFGDKCLFIHPNCRFDSKCSRADCPFTHTSRRRPVQLIQVPVPVPRPYPRYPSLPQPQQAIICHFFPNCLNPSCSFVHPKPCMYGAACKNPVCSFYHPPAASPPAVPAIVPDKGKLKWEAHSSVQAKAVGAVVTVGSKPSAGL